MITEAQITNLRTTSDDFEETERLKKQLAILRTRRKPFFLTKQEFDEVLKWKLRGQYGRQQALRSNNGDDIIRAVTGLAFAVKHEDKEYELELRFGILCALRGVAVPVASAILALVFPDEYAVIDFRGWRQIFGSERRIFSVSDYKLYMQEIRKLAHKLRWPVQEVDLAIWEYDKRHGAPSPNNIVSTH